MRERASEVIMTEDKSVSDLMSVVDEGGSFEKDLRLIGIDFQT